MELISTIATGVFAGGVVWLVLFLLEEQAVYWSRPKHRRTDDPFTTRDSHE